MRFLMILLVALSVGCVNRDSADRAQKEETERMLSDAHKQVGMPDIVNFTERKLARDILELRDSESLVTYCYIVNMHGDLIYLGEAIGFGLPYSVQFTNPEKELRRYESSATIPQADPNGLFMPDGLSATWVLLRDPDSGDTRPVYVEPEIIVSPFKLSYVKHPGE